MRRTGSLYIEQDSIFHRLQGSIKFVLMLSWTVFIFLFMDLRIFVAMTMLGFVLLKWAKISVKTMKPLVMFVIIFTVINSLLLILITPEYGSELSGSFTPWFGLGGRVLTYETLFYALTLSLKYIAILPLTLLFFFTTHPSRFASDLNRIGISYRVAYAINIALRYIPDVAEEMKNIMHAQEARGVRFHKKDAGILKRFQNYMTVLVPLLISSLNRVEVVSNAMDLRGFGRYQTRSWYHRRPLQSRDYICLGISICMVMIGVWFKAHKNIGFWYPF